MRQVLNRDTSSTNVEYFNYLDIEKTYFEAYRFSKLKNPIKFDNEYFNNHSAPMELEDLEILESVVEWDEIIFGPSSIKIKNTKIDNVISYKYYNKAQK